jgi:hypothetical protein
LSLHQGKVNADLALGNVAASRVQDEILDQVPSNKYVIIYRHKVGSLDFGGETGRGMSGPLPLYDENVSPNRVTPFFDPRYGEAFPMQGRGKPEVQLGPEPPDPFGVRRLKQHLYEINHEDLPRWNGLKAITPEELEKIREDIERKHREGEQHSELPSAPVEAAALEDKLEAPQPAVIADLPPAIPEGGSVAVASVRALRSGEAAPGSLVAREPPVRELIEAALAHGEHPPPPPPHPEWGLPSVSRALGTVEAKLRQSAHRDEKIRAGGLRTVLELLSSADAEMRPWLHKSRWTVDEDAYLDLLCAGHWRSVAEPVQLGDVVWMAEPAIPGGTRAGIALAERASQWLTLNSGGSFRIVGRAAGSEVIRAWQPLPREAFNPSGPIGSVWTAKRWRAMLEACYSSDAAVIKDLVGHVAKAVGLRGVEDANAFSARVVGEVRAVGPSGPLWPGAIVFGRRAGDFGVLLPDGRVAGTSAANHYPEHVTNMRLQRFQPRFVWYPRRLG